MNTVFVVFLTQNIFWQFLTAFNESLSYFRTVHFHSSWPFSLRLLDRRLFSLSFIEMTVHYHPGSLTLAQMTVRFGSRSSTFDRTVHFKDCLLWLIGTVHFWPHSNPARPNFWWHWSLLTIDQSHILFKRKQTHVWVSFNLYFYLKGAPHQILTLGLGLNHIQVWQFAMWKSVLVLKLTWKSVILSCGPIVDQVWKMRQCDVVLP